MTKNEDNIVPCKDSWRARNKDGYHVMHRPTYGYSTEHRWLYATHHEINLKNDIRVVRHKCNNPWCVEITHLELGFQSDNIQDSVDAGTHKNPSFIGETNPTAKLSDTEVTEIRDMWDSGHTQMEISKLYHMDRVTITNIVNRKTWRHLP